MGRRRGAETHPIRSRLIDEMEIYIVTSPCRQPYPSQELQCAVRSLTIDAISAEWLEPREGSDRQGTVGEDPCQVPSFCYSIVRRKQSSILVQLSVLHCIFCSSLELYSFVYFLSCFISSKHVYIYI